MVIFKSQNKITDFLMILAWASPFKVHSYHLIFHIKHLSGVHADRNIKDLIYWHTRIKIIQ